MEYVEHWGSDERIIENARQSTDKGFLGWGGRCSCTEPLSHHAPPVPPNPSCPKCAGVGETVGDEKLLKFLWDHKHLTPFESAGLSIEVQAPIFVFREWHRHRTQSYNELSARYTPLPDLYYVPSLERIMAGRQSSKNKQGSDSAQTFPHEVAERMQAAIVQSYAASRQVYTDLLLDGMERGLSRIVVPVGQYSRMRASANLRNWLGFLTLRMDEAAQWEIRQYANVVGRLVEQYFPRTWALFKETA